MFRGEVCFSLKENSSLVESSGGKTTETPIEIFSLLDRANCF